MVRSSLVHVWVVAGLILGAAPSVGGEFVERHEAFLASGCAAKGDACPRSAEELEVANILVIRAMNEGMASTFLPFSCGR